MAGKSEFCKKVGGGEGNRGIYVPNHLFHLFKTRSNGKPPAKVHVHVRDDPAKFFDGKVAKIGRNQRVIHIPFDDYPDFGFGTMVCVRVVGV